MIKSFFLGLGIHDQKGLETSSLGEDAAHFAGQLSGGPCLLLSIDFPTYLSGLLVCCAIVSLGACSLLNVGFSFLLLSQSLFYFCKQFPVFVGLRDLSF